MPGLNSKYTFENFVIGSGNRFSHAAAVSVAEAPALAYNPLFVYGDSGLGKTHLLHAIGNYAQSLSPGLDIRLTPAQEFLDEFIEAVKDDSVLEFRNRCLRVDMLLLDDIEVLEHAERTQEEFFWIFNSLHIERKQVVITSGQPPKRVSFLEERLRTRFEWGLITHLDALDYDTRLKIALKKALEFGVNLPLDAARYIAHAASANIRELEGALLRIHALAMLYNEEITITFVRAALRDIYGGAA